MSTKKIVSVGAAFAIDEIEHLDFDSDASLLDWDIILFQPDISDFLFYSTDEFHGKPSLGETISFQLKERMDHWRREIKDAFNSGKTILVFLPELSEFYFRTGQQEFSGTGKNQKTTNFVDISSNYACIPLSLKPVKSTGRSIKVTHRFAATIATYWKEFSEISQYKTILTATNIPTCLSTKTGEKPVGVFYESKNSSGAMLLVPDIDFYAEEFQNDDGEWTEKAREFSARMMKAVVALDKTIKNQGETTPEPIWAASPSYELQKEKKIKSDLLKTEQKLENIQSKKSVLVDALNELSRFRNLLFEQGKPLEYATMDALTLIGFTTSQYKDNDSEFDVVFESKEGRLLGEVEGKDTKAINISKLRQLEMNILEDLDREEVESPAKGVLFGNPYRLTAIPDRPDPFTEKCLKSAQRSSTALVFTPDLFLVAQYLSNHRDAQFAAKARKTILNSVGLVKFPVIPKPSNAPQESIATEN
jgi:hypothetical protein